LKKAGWLVLSTFGVSLVSLALLATSLLTEHWVDSKSSALTISTNTTQISTLSIVTSNMGLFRGQQTYSGYLANSQTYNVQEVYNEHNDFLNFSLWVLTISALAIAGALVLLAAVFALFNFFTNPIEFIFGIPGLFIWNGGAGLCYFLAMMFWVGEYNDKFRQTSIFATPATASGWKTSLGYSFWLLLVALLLHCVNIGLLWYRTRLTRDRNPRTLSAVSNEKVSADNMLY